jgi:hypothetical protein
MAPGLLREAEASSFDCASAVRGFNLPGTEMATRGRFTWLGSFAVHKV